MSEVNCPGCENSYTNVARHWDANQEHRPVLTDRQHEIITGILMGDGCISYANKNPVLQVRMIKEQFLEWFDSQFGVLTTGVTKIRTSEEQAENSRKSGFTTEVNEENYHDLYMCNTRSLPGLEPYAEWYDSGEKQYPGDLELTPLTLKMWYVTDGNLAHREQKRKPMMIGCSNESSRGDFLLSLFEDMPFSPRFDGTNLWFGVDDTDEALDWMGAAPPGFGYKWNQND
jgi:hypothetical protein